MAEESETSESETDEEEKDNWWVYVLWSDIKDCTYVGCTNCPSRRLKQHNSDKKKEGAKFTRGADDWEPLALYGPYEGRGEATRSEIALKRKIGEERAKWSKEDSEKKKGLGPDHPWVEDPEWEESNE